MIRANKMSKETGVHAATLSELMNVHITIALAYGTLLKAVELLPFESSLNWDKSLGRWIFSNEDDSEWPKEGNYSEHVAGANFSFCNSCPDLAMARGIHYYYHLKLELD